MTLSRPWFSFGGFFAAMKLSRPWFSFGDVGVVGFGFAGAAKAFGSTLKPAASVKVKMSFLYNAIPL